MTMIYDASDYLDLQQVYDLCEALGRQHPQWVEVQTLGQAFALRPIQAVVLGHRDDMRDVRPTLWIDAGTHASEWTSVSAAMFMLATWGQGLESQDESLMDWLRTHTIVVVPCVSPDGYHAMRRGDPFLRSSLRPPKPGTVRSGLEPMDVDGDGQIRWMRWKHPAGPFVADEDSGPLAMRPRTLDDDPQQAYYVTTEGQFIQWDGHAWVSAPRQYGLDLNRNFPAYWAPMSMFGMDSGSYPLSAPESRVLMDAFAARASIGAALTLHTYTGCILTQPYRQDTPLPTSDVLMIQALAQDLVRDTGYKTFKVFPEFMYDPKRPVGGVWAETISTVFGVPGYTVEFWDPYGHAGVEIDRPAEFFLQPDYERIKPLLKLFSEPDYDPMPWETFEHPQLGEVEIGGIDYLRTVRNPPPALLRKECEHGMTMARRIMRALPTVQAHVEVELLDEADLYEVKLVLQNHGYLSTSGLAYAEQINAAPPMSVQWQLPEGATLVRGQTLEALPHIDGWGASRAGAASHSIYPSLPGRAQRVSASIVIRGEGMVQCDVSCGRAGRMITQAQVGAGV